MLGSQRKSRARIAGGTAAVGVLIVTALGLTASGTQAAEGLRAKVGKTIGVDLSQPLAAAAPAPVVAPAVALAVVPAAAPQADARPAGDIDLPAPPQPPAPPSDAARPVPPMPPAPPAPVVDGRAIRAQVDAAMADMPEVSSTSCGGGDAQQVVINDRSGGRNRIVICQDRIAAMAAKGAQVAVNAAEIERNAYRSALAGLQAARGKVEADARLSAEERRDALSSIDDSIRDMQDDLARAGQDD